MQPLLKCLAPVAHTTSTIGILAFFLSTADHLLLVVKLALYYTALESYCGTNTGWSSKHYHSKHVRPARSLNGNWEQLLPSKISRPVENAVNIVSGNYDSRGGIRRHSWDCHFKLGSRRWEWLKNCSRPSGWSQREGKKIFLIENLDFLHSKYSLLHNQRTRKYLVVL